MKRRMDTKTNSMLNEMSSGAFGTLCAAHSPNGESMRPKIAIKPAALYRRILALRPRNAPTPAASAIAERAIGPAVATSKCKVNTNSGTERIPPPAPVKPIKVPIKIPRAGLIKFV